MEPDVLAICYEVCASTTFKPGGGARDTRTEYLCYVSVGARNDDPELLEKYINATHADPSNSLWHSDHTYAQAVVWSYLQSEVFMGWDHLLTFESVDCVPRDSMPNEKPTRVTENYRLWVSETSLRKLDTAVA